MSGSGCQETRGPSIRMLSSHHPVLARRAHPPVRRVIRVTATYASALPSRALGGSISPRPVPLFPSLSLCALCGFIPRRPHCESLPPLSHRFPQQVAQQEVRGQARRLESVAPLGEAVAFIREDDILDRPTQPRSRSTIWSDSALTTRGRCAWRISSGARVWSMYVMGDCSRRKSASVSGSPIQRAMKRRQVGGTARAKVMRLLGPQMSTAADQYSGRRVAAERVASRQLPP